MSSGSVVLDDDVDEPVEFSTPDDGEGHAVHVDGLADRIVPAEELGRRRLAQDDDGGVVLHVLVVEEAALGDRAAPYGSHDGVVPCTVVVAVSLPAVRTSEDEVMPATALMSGASTGEARAATSDMVSVEAEPNAPRMPVVDVVLPGVMVSRLEPSALISEVTCPGRPRPDPR